MNAVRIAGLAVIMIAAASIVGVQRAADARPSVSDTVVSVTYPPERHLFKDGPNADLARADCQVCHSSDYIFTQPPLTEAQWTAEVKKMQGLYGATFIGDADVAKIAGYLVTQNGKQ